MITVYYDETCVFCTTNAEVIQVKNPAQINIMPVTQAGAILAKARISLIEAMTYVVVSDEKGEMHKGMDAVRLLYKTANVPFSTMLSFPVLKQVSDIVYPVIARNRYYFPKWAIRLLYGKLAVLPTCDKGVCQIPPKKR